MIVARRKMLHLNASLTPTLSALSRTPMIWDRVIRRARTPTQSSPTTTTLIRTPTVTNRDTTACSRTSPARANWRWRRRRDSSRLCPHQAQTFPAFPSAVVPPYPVKKLQPKSNTKLVLLTEHAQYVGTKTDTAFTFSFLVQLHIQRTGIFKTDIREERTTACHLLQFILQRWKYIYSQESLFSVSIPLL